MLPAAARLTKNQDFRLVVRRGRRAGRPRVVMHLFRLGPEAVQRRASSELNTAPTRLPRVGFVVSKAVGNAVIRHRVTRRLRHLMRSRLELLPAGTLVVVRALPPAATASSAELGKDLDEAMRKLRVRGEPSVGSS